MFIKSVNKKAAHFQYYFTRFDFTSEKFEIIL